MSSRGWQNIAALASGMLFGAGLVVARATEPAVVLGFLDWSSAWDASLLAMMAAAVLVHAALQRSILRRGRPRWGESFALPTRTDIDARLIGGAALFGVGWGFGGYCPGPSVVALASGRADALVLVGSIALGMLLAARIEISASRRSRASPNGDATQAARES